MRADPGEGSARQGLEPLWWPPGKVAGRHLAPYLAAREGDVPRPTLTDIEPPAGAPEGGLADALDMTLVAADASARGGDFEGALRWLGAAEQLNVALPLDYARRRREWRQALARQRRTG